MRLMIRRLALLWSITLAALVAVAAPATAGPPGPTAGVETSTGLSANYSRFPDDFSMPQINIGLGDSTVTFDPQSGPRSTTRQSQLFVSVTNGDDFLNCFVENPTGFVISSDLSTASLHLTITEATEGCYVSPSVSFPQNLDVTWTAAGTVNTFQVTGHSSCPGFNIETRISNSNRIASSTASVSPMLADSYPALQASVGAGFNRTHTQGSMPPLCQATGGGKGAGPGPAGPGTYRSSSIGAGQQLSNADTGDSIDISAGTTMSSTNPRPGAPTSSTETTVNLQLRSSSFDSGCYVVSPTAFTMNKTLTAGSLHVTLNADTPTCGPFPSTLPLPLTIDVTWTGIGPDTSAQTNIQSDCGGAYRTQSTGSGRSNNSSAVATMSGAIEESFVSHQSEFESSGTMGSIDQTTQVQGSLSACGL
jgi:hypothetical protein